MIPEIVTVSRPLTLWAAEAEGVSTPAVVVGLAGALVLALVLAEVVTSLLRAFAARRGLERMDRVGAATRAWLRALLLAAAGWGAVLLLVPDDAGWRLPVARAVLVVVVLLAAALVLVGVLAALAPPATEWLRRRRAVTAALLVAAVVPLALVGGLAVVPATRPAAVVVLALAVAGWVAVAVVAWPWWQDVLAGIRLAFTDVVRPADVLLHEGELVRVEEVGRTTTVLRRWDDHHVVVPHRLWFAGPVTNLTRAPADLLGTVEVDVQPEVVVADLRAEVERLLQNSATWDHRVGVVQVVDATGGLVRVRAVVSAADPAALADLRSQVREGVVEWLRTGAVRPEPGATRGSERDETVRLDVSRRGTLFGVRITGFEGPDPQAATDRQGRRRRPRR